MEYTREFMTSVVVGKDLVPRIGLHQLEELRHDLMYALQKSPQPKWLTLSSSLVCCGKRKTNYFDSPTHCWTQEEIEEQLSSPKGKSKTSPEAINIHPWDSTINLSVHMPFYPPGKIIHLVRHYPKAEKHGRVEPVYQAIWADNTSFDQVLISKRMVEDHMPDKVLEALSKLLKSQGPMKPRRSMTGSIHTLPGQSELLSSSYNGTPATEESARRMSLNEAYSHQVSVRMETSFTTETAVEQSNGDQSTMSPTSVPEESEPGSVHSPEDSRRQGTTQVSDSSTVPTLSIISSVKIVEHSDRRREMKPIKASNSIKLLRQKERDCRGTNVELKNQNHPNGPHSRKDSLIKEAELSASTPLTRSEETERNVKSRVGHHSKGHHPKDLKGPRRVSHAHKESEEPSSATVLLQSDL